MPDSPDHPIAESTKPQRGRRASGWMLAGPALAAAAALAVWLSNPTSGSLAHYEIEFAGVRQQSAPAAAAGSPAELELARGRDVTIVLRPQGTRTEPVDASVFVASAGSATGGQPVLFVREAAGPGALRLRLAAGAWPEHGRLVVIVGRAGAMPRGPYTGSAQYGRGWQRFDVPFELVASAAP